MTFVRGVSGARSVGFLGRDAVYSHPCVPLLVDTGALAESLSVAVVEPLGSLVRRAARQRERITLTEDDSSAAVLISVTKLEDFEDALAVAQARLRAATGEPVRLPHDGVRRRLGLDG